MSCAGLGSLSPEEFPEHGLRQKGSSRDAASLRDLPVERDLQDDSTSIVEASLQLISIKPKAESQKRVKGRIKQWLERQNSEESGEDVVLERQQTLMTLAAEEESTSDDSQAESPSNPRGSYCSLAGSHGSEATMSFKSSDDPDEAIPSPVIPSCLFAEPCEPMNVAGGTASFFHVHCLPECPFATRHDEFIGKDLSRARDEVGFYNKLRIVSGLPGWSAISEFMFTCPGIVRLRTPCESEARWLLLLENLSAGFQEMRLLDVKLGEHTALAGWKGKSALGAWRNRHVDRRTNSRTEGYRLEGMTQIPKKLTAFLDDVQTRSVLRNQGNRKVFRRFIMQRLTASQFLQALLESKLGPDSEARACTTMLALTEQMSSLVRAVLCIPTPQIWIGSSVALAAECGELHTEPRVRVKLFDWGRSELCTAEEFATLDAQSREKRVRNWQKYVQSICRLFWEVCRLTAHRCCCPRWRAYVFEIRCLRVSTVRAAAGSKKVNKKLVGITKAVALLDTLAEHDSPAVVHTRGEEPFYVPGRSSCLPLRLFTQGCCSLHHTAALHVEVETPVGEGPSVVTVKEMTGLSDAESAAYFVRVLAFEHTWDAEVFMQSWRSGSSRKVPSGCVGVQVTSPGDVQKERNEVKVVWSEAIKFQNLGVQAEEAQGRLQQAMEPLVRTRTQRRSSTTATTLTRASSFPDDAGWLSALPPTEVTEPETIEACANKFITVMAPWTQNLEECPSSWRRSVSMQ